MATSDLSGFQMPGQAESSSFEGTVSPRSQLPNKSVSMAEQDNISPLLHSIHGEERITTASSQRSFHHRGSLTSRLSGRSLYGASSTSLASYGSLARSIKSESAGVEDNQRADRYPPSHGASGNLISQVLEWLHEEKSKRSHKAKMQSDEFNIGPAATEFGEATNDLALEKLERILADHFVIDHDTSREPKRGESTTHIPRKRLSLLMTKKTSTAISSDAVHQDGDAVIPSTDVILDNSKAINYSRSSSSLPISATSSNTRAAKERDVWLTFKYEIVRLAHTLKLKGWRRVSLDRGLDIEVERLSGALTNAVYVVSPPPNLSPFTPSETMTSTSLANKKPPPKLLLRIYGPQVEHLIDREKELQILRRLARKKIGPRLLGTFTNGRFEEFLHARTLTSLDLRAPEISKQIAKRMRELHDGVELLKEERDGGPFLWRNWDKMVSRCEKVITWLDNQIISGRQGHAKSQSDAWKDRGLICGVEWSIFRKIVDKYRRWLDEQYGGKEGIGQQLIFAHNDTQYGNLLRLEPSGESPLLLPANEHKQLVVIDFEYASANTRGLEFANHFSEWCYNYHDSSKPYACRHTSYPKPDEQRRFIKAYVQHRPQAHLSTPTTPLAGVNSSSIPAKRTESIPYAEAEQRREEVEEREIERLMHETRLWRIANSAHWVAWGIVQAKVTDMNEEVEVTKGNHSKPSLAVTPIIDDKTPVQSPAPYSTSDPLSPEVAQLSQSVEDQQPERLNPEAVAEGESVPQDVEDEEEEEGGFDYLGYAQERAMFFWGDLLCLKFIGEESLPREVLQKVKIVDY